MLPFFPAFVPNVLQVFPFVLAFSLLCARPLRAFPGLFYGAWAAVVGVVTLPGVAVGVLGGAAPGWLAGLAGALEGLPGTAPVLDAALQLLTSSFTGVSFYLIVMFAGALERTPWVKRLLSVRTELSVVGGIVIAGHTLRVLRLPAMMASEGMRQAWGSPAGELMFAASTVVGPVLGVLFLVLWVTSFRAVRRRMQPGAWKRLQRLAYPFMALMLAQGFLLALGHLFHGWPYDGFKTAASITADSSGWLSSFAQQAATALMYLALGVGYAVLRLRKWRRDVARRATVRSLRGVAVRPRG